MPRKRKGNKWSLPKGSRAKKAKKGLEEPTIQTSPQFRQSPRLCARRCAISRKRSNEIVDFNILEESSVQGQLLIDLGDHSRSLENGLRIFFEASDCGVVTTNARSIAIMKNDLHFFYFDSHSTDEHGRYADGGRACIITVDTIDHLREIILGNLYKEPTGEDQLENVYTLVPIIVTRRRPIVPQIAQDRRQPEIIPDVAFISPTLAVSFEGSHPAPLAANCNVARNDLGSKSVKCQFCMATFFRNELQFCCGKGKVVLDADPDYPNFIVDLLTDLHPLSPNFKDNILTFHNLFAFASVGANIIDHRGVGLGSMYVIQGKIHHAVTDICPTDNNPQLGHLYYLDSDDAVAARGRCHQQCSPILINELEGFFRRINPYARLYMHLREVVRNSPGRATEVRLQLHAHVDRRNHRYDLPAVPHEVGVVFRANTEGQPPLRTDLLIHIREEPTQPKYLNNLSPLAEPLCYPLLFPFGECGWITEVPLADIRNRKRTRVTRLEYATYKILSIRDSRACQTVNFGKLSQQYLVDVYVKVESDRLMYVRMNQKKLRAHQYLGLLDYVQNAAERENVSAGRTVILPSSFVGGARSIQQHYQDTMAIVAKYGRPDLFITFTCNPKWPEIIANCKTWEEPHNRVDLICRVFRQKLKAFMTDVTATKIFGDVLAYVYVIEFQKRGLPHCHLLITLCDDFKLREPHQIDAIISAEIPDENDDPVLFESVRRHMIHGPCGTRNATAPCMEDGNCKKKFPKPFAAETTVTEDSFPLYRRRDNSRSPIYVQRGCQTFLMDNSAVVPYSPYLIKKFNCHLNIEVCTSVKCVKYIFKYIHKGHDCALLKIDTTRGEYDEVTHYIDSRYVSSSEATWRLLKYPLHETSHTVVRLHFHLPGHNIVYFTDGDEEAALDREATKTSMFLAWFTLNSTDETARRYLYTEIPLHYTYNHTAKRWIKRVYRKSNVIPRMYTISPKHRELFHMRLLLLHVRGAASYEELRTVNGTVHETFENAAREMGLLADDTEWNKCMREAVLLKMPGQLRKLFAYILVCCTVRDPRRLWEGYRTDLIQDYTRKGYDVQTAEAKALAIVERIIRNAGGKYDTYGLPSVDIVINAWDLMEDSVAEADENGDADLRDTVQANKDRFNSGQRDVYEAVMRAIDSEAAVERLFFLDGPGGTGKTFVYNTILDELHLRKENFVSVAWTGIAAVLLRGGRTVHSRFKLPLNVNAASTSSLTMDSAEAQELRTAKIVVWDEVTMVNVHAFDAVDRLLRDVMGDRRSFGGKVVLLGGDFRQCLPILPRAPKTAVIEICILNSSTWDQFKHYRLTENMRAERHQVAFAEWLIKLGEGRLTNTYNELNSYEMAPIPSQCIVTDVITAVYEDIENYTAQNDDIFCNRAILSPKNDGCDMMNTEILSKIPGDSVSYRSADSIQTDDEQEAANFTTEYLNSLTPSGMPPHNLNLKLGVPVMLVRNISVAEGLCNGTRLVVRRLFDTLIEAEISMGHFRGSRTLIPRMDLTTDATTLPFVLQRRQFPVRVCFAMTINKAQGQTFDRIGIYLPNPVFAHGQLYVAFSRVKSWDSVKIQLQPTRMQGQLKRGSTTTYTKNVVYKNLQDLIIKSTLNEY